jgi:NADPH-dependent glutamate synthase beta subunit-like oxidoreductase
VRKQISVQTRTHAERVAIVGAGPAGLTAAFNLVRRGYGVTVFEALPSAGGMLTTGIPEYRLPRDVVTTEIEDIQKCGVEIRLNSPVERNGLTLDGLFQQGYHAVFIATGAHRSLPLGVSGEELEGVHHGAAFLKDVNLRKKEKIGEKVAVIGGGNVAIDAARTALRCGSNEVVLVYRRSRGEMPAYPEEMAAAEKEGVKFHYLAMPSRILGTDGKVAALECLRVELGDLDESGRRRPVPVKRSEFVIDVKAVISAVGEVPDLSFLDFKKFQVTSDGKLEVNPHSLMTNVSGVFAGGDSVTGPATVIEAIAAGKKVAASIDLYLHGKTSGGEDPIPRTISLEEVDTVRFNKRERQTMSALSPKFRVRGFEEVNAGFTELEALREADRCFQCGMFPKKGK